MELAVDFRWRVVVLDDDRIKEEFVTRMMEFGVEVYSLGRPIESVLAAAESLAGAHFVYCDMQWDDFAKQGDPKVPLSVPDSFGGIPEKFVKEWIEAIRYWAADTAPPLNQARKEWPRVAIDKDHVGLWLAAMVRHLSPKAVIILYSSHPEIAAEGELAAIGRFPDTPFAVETKDPDHPLPIENFKDVLRTAQKRYLNERPDLRGWFLSRVLIPTIAGGAPQPADLTNVGGHKNEKVTFSVQTFFPNFIKEGQFDPTGMDHLLDFLGKDMPVWQEAALHSLKHELLDLRDRTSGAATEGAQAITDSLCNECGEAGILIRNRLDEYFNLIGRKDSSYLDEALQICHASLSSRESDLVELCRSYGGEVVYRDSAEDFQPGLEDENKKNPQLPFQYFLLRRTVDALMDNARKWTPPLPILTNHKLETEIDATELTIMWSDNSRGFATMQNFKENLQKSAEKGAMRGLPLAVLFGLRFSAIRIEVLIRGEGDRGPEWHTLWPYGANSIRTAKDETKSFALRWAFKHQLL